jgi:ABC-type uncharacterized transport system involved in gliding motility auxiliary subunit
VAIFAVPSTNPDSTSLAATPALNDYLWANFGVRINENIVVDLTQNANSPLRPGATNFSRTHPITRDLPTGVFMVFDVPLSIEVAETLPEGVTVEPLARSTNDAYTKSLDDLMAENIEKAETDPAGPFVLGAAAENAATGARLILFGSTSPLSNVYALGQGLVNNYVARRSLEWITNFDEYAAAVSVPPIQRPQDTPIVIDQQTGRTINLITIFLLPFGVLAIGVLVWLNNRETAR